MVKPKIALIFAGGTIGMVADKKRGVLKPAKNAKSILSVVPELKTRLDLDFFPVCNLDSTNMTPDHWKMIADKIYELYEKYDGFVIAQGTDTMAYSASALSFAFQDLNKPLVFTGSIVPMSELGADGRNNLIYACLVAAMDLAEVCIVFGNKIIRGSRAKKNHESFVDVFHSPNFPLLGEIERPIVLNNWCVKRSKKKLKFNADFDPNIRLVKLFPGFTPYSLECMIENKVRGIIIEAFGPGNIPFLGESSLLPVIKEAIKHSIPVVVASQMEMSKTNLTAYEAGYKALELGVIPAKDMTAEAAIAKLMWVLAQTKNFAKIKALMEKNLVGELT